MWGSEVLARVVMSVGLVVQWRGMLGVIVAPVESLGVPIKTELILGGASIQPVKQYVRRFDLTRQNCGVSSAGTSGFISLKGRK